MRFDFRSSLSLTSLLALLLLLTATLAQSQDWKGRGRIHGKVFDPAGEPIKGAKVKILFRGEEGQGPDDIVSDKRGKWAYMGLTSGPFTVIVEAEGYVPAQGEIRVNEYQPLAQDPVDVTLQPLGETPEAQSDKLMAAVNEGNRLLQEGRHAEARAKFEEVLAAIEEEGAEGNEKQKAQLQRIIAVTYLEGGQTAEARSRLEALLVAEEDPALQVEMLQHIARSYYLDEQVDASVQTLEKALAIDPQNVAVLRRIVDTLIAAGRETDAEPYMARLPEGEKIDPNALLNLGITAYNQGDMDTALEKFQKVVASYPDNANAFYYLGLVQMSKGMNAEAKASLEKMLALEPDHANADEARQFLEYLETL